MKTRPSFTPRFFVLVFLLLPWLTAVAQGPDDGPPPAPAEGAPPPPPPQDLTQMNLDGTPPPLLDARAQPSPPPAASAQPTPAATARPTPTPAPSRTPSYNNNNRQSRRNAAAAQASQSAQVAQSAPLPSVAATPGVAASPALLAPNATPAPAAPGGGIRFNFQNASLLDVLNYLSASAGFIITQEVPVTGTVNVVSQQPISTDEAVDLLNTILAEKGYVALRSGRILKIIALQDASKRDLPVAVSSNPADIPRKDNMVTQILPVRYAEVGKLVDNLRPLLSTNASISSNDSSNAIILTDTQTNIHRMAEIIHALDTSISGISQIKVFTLRFSDAKGLADVLTQLFSPQQKATQNQFGNLPPQFQQFLQRQGGGGAPAANSPQSEARQAAARVVAVADETSNSVIVAAPDEVMSTVAEVIAKLDTSTSDITETQIFRLLHADATELATVLSSLYSDTGTAANTGGNNNNNNRGGQQNRPNFPGQQNAATAGQSARTLLQTRVVAVADARTNSVLVSASHDTMAQIGVTIGRLDASDSKKQKVYVYTLSHADPDNIATILRGMYSVSGTGSSSTATQPSTSALTTRTVQGATPDITNSLNTNSTSRSGTSR